jgi:hypothetical protein
VSKPIRINTETRREIHRDGQDEQDLPEEPDKKKEPDLSEEPVLPILFILSIPVRMPDLRVIVSSCLRVFVLIRSRKEGKDNGPRDQDL